MDRRGKAIVLVSGGFDSAALLTWALQRFAVVQPVYCCFGLRWEKAELFWLKKFLRDIHDSALHPLAILETSSKSLYGHHWSITGKKVPGSRSPDPAVYLPGRNILLLSQAGVYAAEKGFNKLFVGTLAANPFPDATPHFFKTMGHALTLAFGKTIEISAPFRKQTKRKVLKAFPTIPLNLIFSCLKPKGMGPCGACNKCTELSQLKDLHSPPPLK
jgi:7-cyano-7-deazaguanine synthase